MAYTIYKKNGQERTVEWNTGEAVDGVIVGAEKQRNPAGRYVLPELEYHGEWMGERFVTLNIRCAVPIDFEIGDYIVWRDEKFVMNYDPTVVKKARRGTYGEGFTYDNVKFNALSNELTDIRMLDYVLYDNQLHYTSLPKFSFYSASVDDLADRLQANTNRYCEENGFADGDYWIFVTSDKERTKQRVKESIRDSINAIHAKYYPQGDHQEDTPDQSIDIDNMTVWDAMKYIKEKHGVSFIIRGRHVIIADPGIICPGEGALFEYGKGNGLYEIERVADSSQQVTTKLYGYGSDKNMPLLYYANIGIDAYAKVANIGSHTTIIPTDVPFDKNYFTTQVTDLGPAAIEQYGDMFAVSVKIGDAQDAPTYNTYAHKDTENEVEYVALLKTPQMPLPSDGTNIHFLTGVKKELWPKDHVSQEAAAKLPNNMSVNVLMLPGFPRQSLYEWVVNNGGTNANASTGKATWKGYTAYFSKDKYQPYIVSENADVIGIREGVKFFDGSDDGDDIYPTLENTGNDVLTGADLIEDNGVFAEGATVPTFKMVLPSLGADQNITSEAVISMKSGYCTSRDFNVKTAVRKVENNVTTWECTCERTLDSALGIYFPYSYHKSIGEEIPEGREPYQIYAGDHFVLTGVEMSSTYIEAASERLLEAALLFLSKNDYVRYTYLPKIDEIYMARERDDAYAEGRDSIHDMITEGDLFHFLDDDLHIDGMVYIDQLTIKEYGNGQIPTYEVTLRDEKQVGTLQRIQNQVNTLVSGGGGSGSGGGGGINLEQFRTLLSNYGKRMFLSKTDDDEAAGFITFLKGIRSKLMSFFDGGARFGTYVKNTSGAEINALGDAEFREIRGREALIVPEVRFELAKGVVGVETQCQCGGQIKEVFPDGETSGTGAATLMLEDGELGRIEVGDLCMGVWHRKNESNSANTDDDKTGRMTFSGFSTIYFRVASIPSSYMDGETLVDNSDRHYFTYTLRPEMTAEQEAALANDPTLAEAILSSAGGNGIHPMPLMHFYGRGNSEVYPEGHEKEGLAVYPERQAFTMRTPEYEARLVEVQSWYFGKDNYIYVSGRLNGFEALVYNDDQMFPDPKYGTIDCSLYMKGVIIQVENDGRSIALMQEKLGLLGKDESEVVSFRMLDTYRNNVTTDYNYKLQRLGNGAWADLRNVEKKPSAQNWSYCTVNVSYGDLTANSTTFRILATSKEDANVTIDEQFIVMKNTAVKGADAEHYEIVLSDTFFHIDKDGTLTPNDIDVKVYHVIGKNRIDETTTAAEDTLLMDFHKMNKYTYGFGGDFISTATWVDDTLLTVSDIDSITLRLYDVPIEGVSEVVSGGVYNHYGTLDGVRMEEVATVTIPVVRDGGDGQTTIRADFDDEMTQVPCDQNGAPLAQSWAWSTKARLYHGTTDVALASIGSGNANCRYKVLPESASSYINISPSISGTNFLVTVNGITSSTPDVVKIELTLVAASDASVSGVCTATIAKVRQGQDGEDGEDGKTEIYQLLPNVTAIKVSKSGNYAPNSLYIRVKKITYSNDTVSEEVNEAYDRFGNRYVRYKIDSGSWVTMSSTSYIQTTSATQQVYLELRNPSSGNTVGELIDAESIPVVIDGKDGSLTLWYSAQGRNPSSYPGDWHETFNASSDKYAVTRDDSTGTVVWGQPFRIVGEKGDGANYNDYKFNISTVYSKNTPNTEPPSGCAYSSWQDAPPTPTETYKYLWMSTTSMTWSASANNGQGGYVAGTTTYVRISGPKGQDGRDGQNGAPGQDGAPGTDGRDGVDGLNGMSSFVRYSDDGETFTRMDLEVGNLVKDSSFEELGNNANVVATGTWRNVWNTTYYDRIIISSSPQYVDDAGQRYCVIKPKNGYDCSLRAYLDPEEMKGSTWYTLEFTCRNGLVNRVKLMDGSSTLFGDTTKYVDGATITTSSNANIIDFPVMQQWKRHCIIFKTRSTITTPYIEFLARSGDGTNAINVSRVVLKEGQKSFNGVNLLLNGDFSEGWARWNVYTGTPSPTALTIDDHPRFIRTCVRLQSSNIWQIYTRGTVDDLKQIYLPRPAGQKLTFSFWAKSVSDSSVSIRFGQWTNGSEYQETVSVGSNWQRYSKTFTTSGTEMPNLLISADNGGGIYLTGVKLEVGPRVTGFTLSEQETAFGTKKGAWIGTLTWEHPWPSTNFNDYAWIYAVGMKGAIIRPRNYEATYVDNQGNTRYTVYYAGKENEQYLDVVRYGNAWYQCIKTHGNGTGDDNHHTPNSSTTYWEAANTFQFVATDLLLAEKAYIENLQVDELNAVDSTGGTYSRITAGEFEIGKNSNGALSAGIKMSFDENGFPFLILYDAQGEFARLNRAFFNLQQDSTRWIDKTLGRILVTGNKPSYNEIKAAFQVTVCIFYEGKVLSGDNSTLQYVIGYSDSDQKNPSEYNGKYYTGSGSGKTIMWKYRSAAVTYFSGLTTLSGWYCDYPNAIKRKIKGKTGPQGQTSQSYYEVTLYQFTAGQMQTVVLQYDVEEVEG